MLEEGVDDNTDGQLQATEIDRTYTLGHDIINQADSGVGPLYHFLYDGHGSTRALMDAATAILQRFAYGNMLSGTGLTVAANAWTP